MKACTTDLSRAPLYAQIYDLILARIVQEEFPAGSYLPNEFELAGAYRVSIGTVRKAVDRLVNEGVVQRFQGRGTIVTDHCWKACAHKGNHYSHSDGKTAVNWDYRQFDFTTQKPTLLICEKLSLQGDEDVFFSRRLRTSTCGVKIYEKIFFPTDLFKSGLEDSVPRDALSLAKANGVMIGVMSDDIELVLSPADASEAIGIPLATPVLRTSRVTHDKAGNPVEFRVKHALLGGAAMRITH